MSDRVYFAGINVVLGIVACVIPAQMLHGLMVIYSIGSAFYLVNAIWSGK